MHSVLCRLVRSLCLLAVNPDAASHLFGKD